MGQVFAFGSSTGLTQARRARINTRVHSSFLNADELAASLEFRFLIDRALAARKLQRTKASDAFARTAEMLVREALPEIGAEVGRIASRKGEGADVARRIGPCLSPRTAAAVWIVWILRGARTSATTALFENFRRDHQFCMMVAAFTSCPQSSSDQPVISFETGSPPTRR